MPFIVCLAIPSKIIEMENNVGTALFEGVTRKVSLLLLDDVKIGDWVIVHAGFAIQKLDQAMAEESLTIIRHALGLDDQNG